MRKSAPCLRAAGFIAAAALLQAAPETPDNAPNALGVIDGFLEKAAAFNPAYRADLRPGGDPNRLPSGRLLARGAWLGPFTYRAKTYRELTAAERAGLLGDPRFREFLAAAAGAPPASPAAAAISAAAEMAAAEMAAAEIPPAEMLKPGPFVIALPVPLAR
jgi:hypothetical protein